MASERAPVLREWVEVGHGIRFGVGTRVVAVSTGRPRIVYVGTDAGYVYRSLDGGVSWDELRLLPDDVPLLDVPVMDARAIPFPNDGLLDLFVATPPPGTYSRPSIGGGQRYRHEGPDFLGMRAASDEIGYPGTKTSFIRHGEASRATSYALGGSGARTEIEDPGNLMALYFRGIAAQPGRVNWIDICPSDPAVAFAATNFGAFRTRDMGITWDRVFIGSSEGENEVRCLHCHPSDSSVVYLATAEGLRTSRDGGESWQRSTGNFGVWPVNFVTTHPLDPSRVVVGTELGAYETATGDQYNELYLADTPSPSVRSVTVVRPTTDPNVLYVGTWDGAAFSHDGGRSWTRMGEMLLGHYRIRALLVDPDDPMHAYVQTDYHLFETRDGGHTLDELWVGYTDLKLTILDPEEPGALWLVGHSQVWRFEEPRRPRPGPPSALVRRARTALARDPGHYAVQDEALRRARLDGRSIREARHAIRRASRVPTLDIVGWGYLNQGRLDLSGDARISALSGYYNLRCRRRVTPLACDYANPYLAMTATSRFDLPYFGALAVLSWPLGRTVMDERSTGRIWQDVFAMRNNVMYTVYDYWTDRRRLLEYLAGGTSSDEEELAFSLRLEEMSAVLDGMTAGMIGGPFGELSGWEIDR